MAKISRKKKVKGIALLIHNQGQILTIEEQITKPNVDKKAGDYSIPMETMENNELLAITLKRLLLEEMGLNMIDIDINCNSLATFSIKGNNVKLYCGKLRNRVDVINKRFCPRNKDEVKEVMWMDTDEFFKKELRCGAREMVEFWLNRNNINENTGKSIKCKSRK